MRRSGLKQIPSWITTTDTAVDAAAAATLLTYNLLIGTTDLVAGQPIDEATVKRVLVFPTVIGGVADTVFHAGIMVQNNEGAAINPRTSANDSRWMWWWTGLVPALTLWQPNDFNNSPHIIKVMRKLARTDVLRFYFVATTACSVMIQTRVLMGAGLRRS